jgi:hypothetical protein
MIKALLFLLAVGLAAAVMILGFIFTNYILNDEDKENEND